MQFAPCFAKPSGPANKLAWKEVLPVLGLAPISIKCPALMPSTCLVKDGTLNVHLASKSFLANKVSISMSSHSTLRLGVKSSPYISSICLIGSKLE